MENNNQEYNTVTLMLDDNTECECAIIRIFPAGDNDYIALLPLEGEAADNDEEYLTDTRLKATTNLYLRILNLMKNMSLYLKHLTKN